MTYVIVGVVVGLVLVAVVVVIVVLVVKGKKQKRVDMRVRDTNSVSQDHAASKEPKAPSGASIHPAPAPGPSSKRSEKRSEKRTKAEFNPSAKAASSDLKRQPSWKMVDADVVMDDGVATAEI